MIDVRTLEDYWDYHAAFHGPSEVLETTYDTSEDALRPLPPEHQGFIGFMRLKERRDDSR